MYSLTRSAIGQALLAAKPNAEVIKLVRRCNAEADEAGRVKEADYMALIEQVRRDGYAVTTDYFAPGRKGVAAAVISPRDGATFAVGFGGPAGRIDAKLDLILDLFHALQAVASEGHASWREITSAPLRYA
jgi:DNA-binding IclR family transcriptional regulator